MHGFLIIRIFAMNFLSISSKMFSTNIQEIGLRVLVVEENNLVFRFGLRYLTQKKIIKINL